MLLLRLSLRVLALLGYDADLVRLGGLLIAALRCAPKDVFNGRRVPRRAGSRRDFPLIQLKCNLSKAHPLTAALPSQ